MKERDVNFCYESIDGLLWSILDTIFDLNLKYENTEFAITQRKNFLIKRSIGIYDIVASVKREKINASDIGMQDAKLRDLIKLIQKYPKIKTILFTGENSKNGPEYFFRSLLHSCFCSLETVSNTVPRIHRFDLPKSLR